MITRLGKSCSFSFLCVCFVNVYQFIFVLLSLLVLRLGCRILLALVPDNWLSLYFPLRAENTVKRRNMRHTLQFRLLKPNQ